VKRRRGGGDGMWNVSERREREGGM
jgi:hypothetical protein